HRALFLKRRQDMKPGQVAGWVLAIVAVGAVAAPLPLAAEDLEDKVERMEQELQELKRQLQEQKAAQEKAQQEQKAAQEKAQQEQKAAEEKAQREAREKVMATPQVEQATAEATPVPIYRKVLDRVRFGGYASMRFEHSNLDEIGNTF